jgi:hypothetical protein
MGIRSLLAEPPGGALGPEPGAETPLQIALHGRQRAQLLL